MNGMKIRRSWIGISLFVTVMVSVIFSWLIWSRSYPMSFNSDKETVSSNITHNSLLDSVYLPKDLLQVKNGEKYNSSLADNEALNKFEKQISEWRLRKINNVNQYSEKGYQKLIDEDKTLQFKYSDVMPYSIFAESILPESANKISENFDFTRIIIREKDRKNSGGIDYLYFCDDYSHKVYKISADGINFDVVNKLFSTKMPKYRVSERKINQKYVLIFKDEVPMQTMEYLISVQPDSFYVTELFETDSKDKSINEATNGNFKTYTDSSGKSLTINQETGGSVLNSYGDTKNITKNLASFMVYGYSMVNKTDTSLMNLEYFSANQNAKHITYLSSVDGWLVFDQTKYGSAAISVRDNQNAFYFSTFNLQVPLPTSKPVVNLPPTDKVIEQLHQSGIKNNDIQDIILGYEWNKPDKQKEYVILTPTYFVEYKDEYLTLNNLINNVKKS